MPTFSEVERKPGVYRARFTKLDPDYRITDKDSGEELVRWRWVFQETADPTTVGEMDTITSTSFKPRTNGRRFLTGMLGREPVEGDDTDALIGQEFDVTYGPNQGGRNTVISVTKLYTAPRAMSASAEAQGFASGVARAGELKRAQEGETATFRGTEVPVTDPVAEGQEDLPF